jgi:hypothetical protein
MRRDADRPKGQSFRRRVSLRYSIFFYSKRHARYGPVSKLNFIGSKGGFFSFGRHFYPPEPARGYNLFLLRFLCVDTLCIFGRPDGQKTAD